MVFKQIESFHMWRCTCCSSAVVGHLNLSDFYMIGCQKKNLCLNTSKSQQVNRLAAQTFGQCLPSVWRSFACPLTQIVDATFVYMGHTHTHTNKLTHLSPSVHRNLFELLLFKCLFSVWFRCYLFSKERSRGTLAGYQWTKLKKTTTTEY